MGPTYPDNAFLLTIYFGGTVLRAHHLQHPYCLEESSKVNAKSESLVTYWIPFYGNSPVVCRQVQ